MIRGRGTPGGRPARLVVGLLLVGTLLSLSAAGHAQAPADSLDSALARIALPPRGLPTLDLPADNPPTAAKIRLGRKLFLDRRLSQNGTLSCAMCHVPEQGFTVNEIATAVGNAGASLRRNAPTLLNVSHARRIFHDGRATTLEAQALAPLVEPDEMANPSVEALLARIAALPDYAGMFERAFGEGPTASGLGRAIASYERTLLAADAPFDRWYSGERADALNDAQIAGFRLFMGKGGCAACHRLGAEAALFTDGAFHDTGIGARRARRRADPQARVRVQLAPGVFTEMARSTALTVGKPPAPDLGRYEVTGDPADVWRYKTPTLRNVALTAPYMHDGSIGTLRGVVDYYDRGGAPSPNLDARIRPLALTDREAAQLVAFLRGLTGSNIDVLVREARAQAVGNPG